MIKMIINKNTIEDNIKFFSVIALISLLIGIYGIYYKNYPVAIISIAFIIWYNIKTDIADLKNHNLKQYHEVIKHLEYLEDRKR